MGRSANPDVKEFILRQAGQHPTDIATQARRRFGLSRTAINNSIKRLIDEGLIEAEGHTRARTYKLKTLKEKLFCKEIDYLWTEDDLWRQNIRPLTEGLPQNVIDICHYGVTEMVNNVLDHARSPDVAVYYKQDYAKLTIMVMDKGVGIFEKIQHDFNLDDPRSALLELSKGRLTSDKRRHSGEGIYFTSRMFDYFAIHSGSLYYHREKKDEDGWLIETREEGSLQKGTSIEMTIRTDATWSPREVFRAYEGDTHRFRKTHVPVGLAQYPGEQLVSRSQAKRLLARLENFSEVFLDFYNVEQIGQPFADEIFRVYANANPDVRIRIARANEAILRMISFVRAGEETAQPDLFEKT